jgi:hypothetical protein
MLFFGACLRVGCGCCWPLRCSRLREMWILRLNPLGELTGGFTMPSSRRTGKSSSAANSPLCAARPEVELHGSTQTARWTAHLILARVCNSSRQTVFLPRQKPTLVPWQKGVGKGSVLTFDNFRFFILTSDFHLHPLAAPSPWRRRIPSRVTARSSLAESEFYPPAGLVVLRNLRNATCVI